MKDIIEKAFLKSIREKINRNSRRDEAVAIHASGVYSLCSRLHAIANRDNLGVGVNYIPPERGLTFEIGKHIQDIVIEHLSEVLIGMWACRGCNTVLAGKQPNKCPACSCTNKNLEYKEVSLKYKVGNFDVVCSFDGFIQKRGNEVYPLEIKSLKPDDFDKLTIPSVAYVYQVNSCLWLAKKAVNKLFPYKINTDKAYIMYIRKTESKSPVKVFEITPSKIVFSTLNKAVKDLKAYSKTGKLPERICNSEMHLMAKNCKLKEICWGKVEAGNGKT